MRLVETRSGHGTFLKACAALSAALLIAPGAAAPVSAAENVNVVVGAIKGLTLKLNGFVETDVIADTTQAFNETQGNALIPKRTTSTGADNFAGLRHRTQITARDSRVGMELTLPKADSGLSTAGIIEADFVGNNAATQQPGGAAGTQSENTFFANAAMRLRHAYMNLTYGGWNLKTGQTWSLIGWQPYYLMGELSIAPAPAEPFGRLPQVRLTHTLKAGEGWTLESALGAAKPAQMNSGGPEMQGGLRFASTKTKAPQLIGGGSPMVGLSAAVSAALFPIQTNGIGNPTGQIVVFDLFVPIIPSVDGASRSNTLSWAGEFMTGTGAGLEYPSLAFGVPGITATTPNAGSAIDAGIVGLNASGNAELIRSRAFHTHLTYVLPGGQWGLTAAYAQVEGRNLDRFSSTAALSNAIAPKKRFGLLGVFYDPAAWLRLGAEVSRNQDTYNDPANRFAANNRYQLSSFFVF